MELTMFGEPVTLTWVLLNTAYAVYVASSMCKRMISLRVVMIVATALFIAYGALASIWSIVWWNIPFGLMHMWQLAKLLSERRGTVLNTEQEAIRTLLLPSLEDVEFARLWRLGEERTFADDQLLVAEGAVPDALMLVLDGTVEVRFSEHSAHPPVPLGRLSLLGEMSVLTGEPSMASVNTVGPVRMHWWPGDALTPLDELRVREPKIHAALMGMVGRDLVKKLR